MGEVWEQSHGAKLCICNKYMEVGVDEIGVDYGTLMIKLLLLLISRSMSCLPMPKFAWSTSFDFDCRFRSISGCH